jgi:hypothetical protein
MDSQDLARIPQTGEEEDDAGPEIGGWSAFVAVLLGAGFVVYMMSGGMGDAPMPGSHWRLRFLFILLGGAGITGIAMAALARIRKPKPEPPAAQDLS